MTLFVAFCLVDKYISNIDSPFKRQWHPHVVEGRKRCSPDMCRLAEGKFVLPADPIETNEEDRRKDSLPITDIRDDKQDMQLFES